MAKGPRESEDGRQLGAGSEGEVTRLLTRWKGGDETAADELLPLVYDDLRSLAAGYLGSERVDHTLQPTALVHEAYLRVARFARLDARDRSHFFAVAARAMRRILVDHARRHRAEKRPGAYGRTVLEEATVAAVETPAQLLAVDGALAELAGRHPRPARLVELRFFGGLSEAEAADVLGISRATATRDWRFARLWLVDYLSVGGATA